LGGVKPCSDFAKGSSGSRLSGTVAERLLAVTVSPALLAEIGPALPLLVAIIMECGENNQCDVNLHDQAGSIGVSHTTAKGWLRRLRDQGRIESSPIGSGGVRVHLILDLLPSLSSFDDAREQAQKALEALRALKVSFGCAVDGVLGQLVEAGAVA
jgi:hypothetical protein